MSKKLEGKVCIVTGASSGIGMGIATAMAENGGIVIVADVQEEKGKEVCENIVSKGGSAVFYKLDVSDESNWKNLIDFCQKTFNRLDVLVNNAGIAFIKPILEMTIPELRRVMSINLEGVFLGIKYSVPLMKKNGEKGGSIINISSNYIFIPSKTQAAYCASKSGVASITKVSAIEFAGDNIRVNTVYPGTVATGILGPESEEMYKMFARTTLAGRIGKPEDIANPVVFLASDDSSWITGTDFIIDGGEVVKRTFYDDLEKMYKEKQKV